MAGITRRETQGYGMCIATLGKETSSSEAAARMPLACGAMYTSTAGYSVLRQLDRGSKLKTNRSLLLSTPGVRNLPPPHSQPHATLSHLTTFSATHPPLHPQTHPSFVVRVSSIPPPCPSSVPNHPLRRHPSATPSDERASDVIILGRCSS